MRITVFLWPDTIAEARNLPRDHKRLYWKAMRFLVGFVGKTRAERRNAWREAWDQLRRENRAAKMQTRKQTRKAAVAARRKAA